LRAISQPDKTVNHTRVKICGITSQADAEMAVAAGADALGLVFYTKSPRAVTVEQAQLICAVIPAFVTVVALTVNADDNLLEQITALPVDLLQFHGDESPEQCERWGKPYIKALRMKGDVDVEAAMQQFSSAKGLLLDAYQAGVPGGTGETFEWQRIPQQCRHQIILAGGLKPSNVAEALEQVNPYAVDVSGGVEASPGKKDAAKVQAFIDSVRQTNKS
jgi:phosphoribosylanthranilate isomerase